MTPAGLAAVHTAQANGTWSALDTVDALQEPPTSPSPSTANRLLAVTGTRSPAQRAARSSSGSPAQSRPATRRFRGRRPRHLAGEARDRLQRHAFRGGRRTNPGPLLDPQWPSGPAPRRGDDLNRIPIPSASRQEVLGRGVASKPDRQPRQSNTQTAVEVPAAPDFLTAVWRRRPTDRMTRPTGRLAPDGAVGADAYGTGLGGVT